MGIVFISYRREQCAGEARALYDDLVERIGQDRVFMDVDDIPPGRDFREVLRERLADTQVLLALIGREWADAQDRSGRLRLQQPDDFVRQEIATALARNVQVVPVLVQGAQFPPADMLPPDLGELSFRNRFAINHTTWNSNVDDLVQRLGLAQAKPKAAGSGANRKMWIGVGMTVVALGVVVAKNMGGTAPTGGGKVQAVAVIPDELSRIFRDLGGPEGDLQRAAAQRLRGDLLRSPEAVSHAIGMLNTKDWFPMQSYKGRSELVGFLIDAEDVAYPPAIKAQAKVAVREMRQKLDSGKATVRPESAELLGALQKRLER